jgi:hypothetical protein
MTRFPGEGDGSAAIAARLPVRDGINEMDVAPDQAGKSAVGSVSDKLAQPFAIRIRLHYE